MRILDACLLCILCVEANCYDYYDYLPEPVPLTVHDLPPGHLEDIDGEDVHVQTPLGDVLGRRRIEKIDLGENFSLHLFQEGYRECKNASESMASCVSAQNVNGQHFNNKPSMQYDSKGEQACLLRCNKRKVRNLFCPLMCDLRCMTKWFFC